MNRSAVALVFAALAACSASNTSGGNTTGDTDSGVTPGADVVSGGSDAGVRTDTGVRTDSGARTDAGSTDPYNFGMCGRSVIQALCQCGPTDQNCQQTALQRSMACVQCMADFQTTCCPTEVNAVQDCFTNSGCMDQACAVRACMTQINAATMCVNSRLQMQAMSGGGACIDGYLRCLGDLPTMQAAVCASF